MESTVFLEACEVEENQMSLLNERMETCTMLTCTETADGMGGYTRAWTDGVSFPAAIVFDNSIEARRASKEGVSSVYTVTTRRATLLVYHDVFRRERDQKIFRVTSDGDDLYTPASAGLDMRNVSAEEWALDEYDDE